jgi:hypothetical protein
LAYVLNLEKMVWIIPVCKGKNSRKSIDQAALESSSALKNTETTYSKNGNKKPQFEHLLNLHFKSEPSIFRIAQFFKPD